MRIHYVADIHVEMMRNKAGLVTRASQVVLDQIRAAESDVLVVAGDLNVKRRSIATMAELAQGRPCVIVAGNHDFYDDTIGACIAAMRQQSKKHPNVHFLERESVEIGGVVFLGCTLWTSMRLFQSGRHAGLFTYQKTLDECQAGMSDYLHILRTGGKSGPVRPIDTVKIWQKSVRWLHEQIHAHQGKRIVVVTHHAPSLQSVDESGLDILSAAYASHLDRLIEIHQPALWIHGHVHDVVDYTIGKTRIVSNCRGYSNEIAEAMGFDPARTLEV